LAEGVLPRKELVTLATFDLTAQTTGQVGTKNVGVPQTFTPAIAWIFRADDANVATIKWGMGNSATQPLAKGETDSMDLMPPYFADLSQLCISGTAGDIIHVAAAIIQASAKE
jgi:hypothetical protein